jgi:rod shape-determining protein MreD
VTGATRVLLRAVLLVAAVLLPSAWPTGVPRPDLVLLVVAAAALRRGPATGVVVGLAGGWLLDLVPPGAEPLGATALTYAALGALLGLARGLVPVSPLVPWVATATACASVLAVRWVAAAAGFGQALPLDLLLSWLVTVLVAALLLPALLALERRAGAQRWA